MAQEWGFNLSQQADDRTTVMGRMKLAQSLMLSEADFIRTIKDIEKDPLFHRLSSQSDLPVVRHRPFSKAFYAKRFMENMDLATDRKSGFAELDSLINENSGVVGLIKAIGEKNFSKYFITSLKNHSVQEIAQACQVPEGDVETVRHFMDKYYCHSEFVGKATPSAEVVYHSTVAQVQRHGEEISLGLLSQQILKGRYVVEKKRLEDFMAQLPRKDRGKVKRLIKKIELVNFRKGTMYGILEILMERQKAYFISGQREQLRPLTQMEASRTLGVDVSVVNRLISNKAIGTPWGTDIPLWVLFPSKKDVMKIWLEQNLEKYKYRNDFELTDIINQLHGVRLSRRSIAQYRLEIEKEAGIHQDDAA